MAENTKSFEEVANRWYDSTNGVLNITAATGTAGGVDPGFNRTAQSIANAATDSTTGYLRAKVA